MLLKGHGRKMNFSLYIILSNKWENISKGTKLAAQEALSRTGNIKEHVEEVEGGGIGRGMKTKELPRLGRTVSESSRPELLRLVELLKTRKGLASYVQRQTVNKEGIRSLLAENGTLLTDDQNVYQIINLLSFICCRSSTVPVTFQVYHTGGGNTWMRSSGCESDFKNRKVVE